jgi:hypothetical protein
MNAVPTQQEMSRNTVAQKQNCSATICGEFFCTWLSVQGKHEKYETAKQGCQQHKIMWLGKLLYIFRCKLGGWCRLAQTASSESRGLLLWETSHQRLRQLLLFACKRLSLKDLSLRRLLCKDLAGVAQGPLEMIAADR